MNGDEKDQEITLRTATPPRFFTELKGKAWMIADSDLMVSNFIPNCNNSFFKYIAHNEKYVKEGPE